MTGSDFEPPPHAKARWAGAIYLVVVAGMFSLGYAPSLVFAGNNDAEIVQSIASHERLLQLSIVAEAICYLAFLILPLALHRFLAPAGRFTAMIMVALATMSVPLGFAGLVHLLDIVRMLAGDAAQLSEVAVMTALNSY